MDWFKLREKNAELEKTVEEQGRKLADLLEKLDAALATAERASARADAEAKTAEAVTKDRDRLKGLVREQTDNDLAIAALKTLGIIPGKPQPGELERLRSQRAALTQASAFRSCQGQMFGQGSLLGPLGNHLGGWGG